MPKELNPKGMVHWFPWNQNRTGTKIEGLQTGEPAGYQKQSSSYTYYKRHKKNKLHEKIHRDPSTHSHRTNTKYMESYLQ